MSYAFSFGFLAGFSCWASPPGADCNLPPHQGALVLRDAAGHRAQPTLESVGIKPVWGCVRDEILALCRGEISSQTLLWRQVSAENLKFVNSLYPQLHRENLCCTEMSEHLTAFINCWRGFVQEKKSISGSYKIRYIEYLHGCILLFRDHITHKTSTFLTS